MKKSVIVIGAGPGGYVAAIRAAQLGADVQLVENDKLGGTCLNVGCIPTKVLLHTANYYKTLKNGKMLGLQADNVAVDWPALLNRKQSIVSQLTKGVEGLLKSNGVAVHKGKAQLTGKNAVKIEGKENPTSKALNADGIILATGSEPIKLKLPGADLPGVVDSTGALSLTKVPVSMVIVGGGVIGVEFAYLYNIMGCKVTVVEALPEILPPVDGELTALVKKELAGQGVTFITSSTLKEIRQAAGGLSCQVVSGGKTQTIQAEIVLMAVGRRPVTQNLGLEQLGIKTDNGKIVINEHYLANVPGIYAIGDCNGQNMLAHAASAQGIAAVEHLMGLKTGHYVNTVPYCIYTVPEVAGVGLTEEQAKAAKISYKVGKFPLAGNGKSLIENGGIGLIKIIADAKHGEILGAHLMGPKVTEMITEIVLAINAEATIDEIVDTIHPHPTVSESLNETAMDFLGAAIHFPPRVKAK
jgi:dihydrolipoyl dehydrogenase